MKKIWMIVLVFLILLYAAPKLLVQFFPVEMPDATQQTLPQLQPTQADDAQRICVLTQDGVEYMQLEEYLTGVLLCEMPASFHEEALKAQAVVARTYALKRCQKADKHSQGAVCVNASCCQGYRDVNTYLQNGGDEEAIQKLRNAVEVTKGQVLTYNGALIEANYFSCSGGRTEDALAVWGSDVPYLKSVESPGEEAATYYTDTVIFTAKEFAELLGDELSGHPGTWIKNVTYTQGGGVDTVEIGNVTYSGMTVRKLLGLRSTAFMITATGDNLVITTKGFGHRVGMSQYGADAMAVLGSTYPEILAHYYQGATLDSWG